MRRDHRGHRAHMRKFSALALLWEGLRGQQGWGVQWRSPKLEADYEAVIVGGGAHGLGAAYYLAREHGLSRIAVLEKGWIGGGNTGATPPSSARTTYTMRAPRCMSIRLSSGSGCPRC